MAITKVNNDLQDALAAAQPTITSVGTLTGLTVSGEITANGGIALGDNDELTLGDSDEFKIKHHASGYTHLQNTVGTLYIDSDSVTFRDDDGSPSNMVISQTGIDVTGTATADALTVQTSTYTKINSYFSGSYTSGFKFSDMNGGIWYDASTDDLTVSASHANSQLILEAGGAERMRINNTGAIFATGVRSSSSANNDLRYNTANGEIYYQTSSERYKSNIVDLEFDTSNLYNLRPVSFDDNETGERCFGLIAEDTFEQIPEAVVTRNIDGETVPDSIPYAMLSVLIINEMKNLKAENDSLKSRIEALEAV